MNKLTIKPAKKNDCRILFYNLLTINYYMNVFQHKNIN